MRLGMLRLSLSIDTLEMLSRIRMSIRYGDYGNGSRKNRRRTEFIEWDHLYLHMVGNLSDQFVLAMQPCELFVKCSIIPSDPRARGLHFP